MSTVLLLTHSGDFYTIDRVMECIKDLGYTPVRLNTNQYPERVQLAFECNNQTITGRLHLNDQTLPLDEVRSVWSRRLWPSPSATCNPQYRAHCQQQSNVGFFSFFPAALNHCYWINEFYAQEKAENKLWQLQLAHQIGLNIPNTLFSNSAQEVKQHYHHLDGNMITKLIAPLSQTMDGSGIFMYTSPVQENDINNVHNIQFAPQIFQNNLPKACELRIIVVGNEVFSAGIDANSSLKGKTDWRRTTTNEDISWFKMPLPCELETQLKKFLTEMGLVYGAFDFILTPNDEYVFLELNPAGEWGWLQKDLNYPIAEAVANQLAQPDTIKM